MRQVGGGEGIEETAEGVGGFAGIGVCFWELGFGVFGPEAQLRESVSPWLTWARW
jgi:hypothetical protein